MLAHRLLSDGEVRRDLAGGEFVPPHQLQHLSPLRIRERPRHGIGP